MVASWYPLRFGVIADFGQVIDFIGWETTSQLPVFSTAA
jgi:hypothetical protein